MFGQQIKIPKFIKFHEDLWKQSQKCSIIDNRSRDEDGEFIRGIKDDR
jgi:hypothetical protein